MTAPESNAPNPITALHELLQPAIAELLRRIPETWQIYGPDDLTYTQSQALYLVTAAGLIERREGLRLRMLNHPLIAEATITFTGECGGVEALQPLVASLWADWQDAYRKWMESDARNVPFSHCERMEPSEWRLTDQGVVARKSLADGEQNTVFDFVLKRGFFDGQPRLVNGRVCRREPVRGNGALVKMTKTKGEPVTPGTVNVGNWGEGAEAFARVFEAVNAKAAQGRPTVKAAKRSWTQPDLDKAIWEYKAKRAPRYQDLVQAVKRGDRGARASARKLFGRNAIARELGVRSPSMVSNSAAWLEIARELQLPLARDRAKGTRRTRRSGKIGEEIGFEQQAVADAPESDPATPLLRAEREETLRMIRSLPNDQAGPILSKYDAGVITDEQARGQVKTLLNQA